jgi:receptor protein-tyrosine kinase
MQQPESQLTLRDYLAPALARYKMILVIVVIVTAAVYVLASRRSPVYTASTKVFVGQEGNATLGIGSTQNNPQAVADQAILLTSSDVAAKVARSIGYTGSPSALAADVTATPAQTTDFITITAQARTGVRAARIANAFAQQFIAQNSAQQAQANNKAIGVLQQQLHQLPRTAATANQRSSLISQIQQLQVASSTGIGNVSQIDPAQPPPASNNRPATEYAGLAAVAAVVGSILLAYMLNRLDPRLKTVEQAGALYGCPVIGTVMHDTEIEAFIDGAPALSSRSREPFRELRVRLDLVSGEPGFRSILVTSAGPAEGKSTVARNLALAFSETGRRVALIDADLRKPRLSSSLGVTPEAGLSEVLAGSSTLEEVKLSIDAHVHGVPGLSEIAAKSGSLPPQGFVTEATLTLIPAGATPPNPPAVLESAGFRQLLTEITDAHDVVVIDTTPVTAVSDAISLLGHVESVVLVARSGTTDRRGAKHAHEVIGRVPDANVVGVVVNDLPAAEASAYGVGYGYRYRYGYGYGSGSGGSSLRPRTNGAAAEVVTPDVHSNEAED